MMKYGFNPLILSISLVFTFSGPLQGQDSSSDQLARTVVLDPVVIRASRYDFNIAGFIRRIENDTSFYKAFKTLRILGYTARNQILVYNKKGKVTASLQSITREIEENGCRHMVVLKQKTTGNFYTRNGNYRYFTAQMYGSLFLPRDTVCGEDNLVNGGINDDHVNDFRVEKHVRQLKILIFNPGKRVPGIPVVGRRVAIFDKEIIPRYNFSISKKDYRGTPCWLFTAIAKPEYKDKAVILNLKTYYDTTHFHILYRSYTLAFKSWLFDFHVHMEVSLTQFRGYQVPDEIRYQGNWGIPIGKREKVDFTLKMDDFKTGVDSVSDSQRTSYIPAIYPLKQVTCKI